MPHPWLPMLRCVAVALALAGGAAQASLVLPAGERCQLTGPFDTLHRAIEAAQAARERGANPTTFRTPDGYFVRAC
jgi:hypothetical protein